MKKTYEIPVVEMMQVLQNDILTVSLTVSCQDVDDFDFVEAWTV